MRATSKSLLQNHALDLADDEQVADHRDKGMDDDIHQCAVE
jgi:hypothetical protein